MASISLSASSGRHSLPLWHDHGRVSLGILIPFGFGTVARSWLVARRENLKLPSVLAAVALDRLTDGIIFASLVPAALLLVAFSDPSGGIRASLVWGGSISFVLFALALMALVGYRRGALKPGG